MSGLPESEKAQPHGGRQETPPNKKLNSHLHLRLDLPLPEPEKDGKRRGARLGVCEWRYI